MALLLALSASPEELEVALVSVTYGNVPLQRYAKIFPETVYVLRLRQLC